MIFITGDCHSDFGRFTSQEFPIGKELTKDDVMIICGDFGGIWHNERSMYFKEENYNLDWLNNKPFTTVFVDGNHECVNSESEVLTEFGWRNIKDVYKSKTPIKIANVNLDTHELHFDYPIKKIRKYSKTIIDILGKNYKQSVTPNHDVLIDGQKIKASDLLGQTIREEQFRFSIEENEEGIDIPNEIIEILTTIVMDATIVDYHKKNPNSQKIRIQYHLKKQRKIVYIMNLLDEANIHYTVRNGKNDDVYICIHGNDGRYLYNLLERKKEFPRYFINMNRQQFKFLFNGICQTDGTLVLNNIIWRTTSSNDIDIVQELCLRHNYDMRVAIKDNASGFTMFGKRQYICSFGPNKQLSRRVKIIERQYNDYAYCFTMPHGTLITRYQKVACITGNCFTRLSQFPVKEWNGGRVHEIRPNVLHLMRGEVYDIDGTKVFAFGGASSHDIKDGILDGTDPNWKDQARELDKQGKWMFRVKGFSWWEEELPNEEEMQNGLCNLEKHDWDVDLIITHSPPASIIALLGRGLYNQDILTEYLEDIRSKTNYSHWYMGHMHINRDINDKDHILYEDIVPYEKERNYDFWRTE